MKKIPCLGFAALLAACTPIVKAPLKTQLETREFQTRTFATSHTNEVLSAVVEAFQDQGFMVKNVVPEVGLVSASREADLESSDQLFFRNFFLGRDAIWEKNALMEATAHVKTHGKNTKVRVNFQEKIMNNRGAVDSVYTIEDPKFYQNFFEKMGKSIFIEKQRI